MKIRKNAQIRNRNNQIPQLMKKRRKSHKQENQEVNPFPTGDHKAARKRHDDMAKTSTKNKNDPQKKHRLGRENWK